MKRAYKLQEFVAHSSNVNCLKIGRKTSRVLVTGGEDHKVNMWAIGKPNAILSLSGHSSPVESVTFDAAESLVVAGAASGTIKLWDLEEAKIVRTLTGHRSNCVSVDFHPFGEFFASGSSDTNLKMWDIRRKGCIHTYKGHTRGVNCLKFSPDGRWIVSGGEDNIVKLWDLTAGKLIHDFKYHAGQILSLDFHPHEFLLTTGSDDRTAKFYDLETFELIGSSGPETTGIRSMVFTPDGRSLLCALQESLKVYSWEPLRCHDVIDASWSNLADMNVHEGKLLGCSFHQSCVGVWVVDLSRVAPFKSSSNSAPVRDVKAPATGEHQKISTLLSTKEGSALTTSALATMPRRSNITRGDAVVSRTADSVRLSTPDPSSLRHFASSGVASNRVEESGPARSLIRLASLRKTSGELVKRNGERETELNYRLEAPTSASRNALVSDRTEQIQSELRGDRIATTLRDDNEMLMRKGAGRLRKSMFGVQGDALVRGSSLTDAEAGSHPRHMTSFGASTTGHLEVGRPRSSSGQWDINERYNGVNTSPSRNGGKALSPNIDPFLLKRTRTSAQEPVNDMQVIEEIMQERTTMTSTMQSRLAKLQVVRRFWMKNDLKSAAETMAKMGDNSVLVDGLSVLIERSDVFTLEIAAMLLPLLNGLLRSDTQRHIMVSIAFTSMLARNFGHVIQETIAACPSLGVDLQAERRLERCNACLKELQTFKQGLKPFLRKNGEIGKAAQDLNLVLERML